MSMKGKQIPYKKDCKVAAAARRASRPAPNARTTRMVTLPQQAVEFVKNGERIAIEFADVRNVRMMRSSGRCYGYVDRGGTRYRAWRLGESSAWVAYPAPR